MACTFKNHRARTSIHIFRAHRCQRLAQKRQLAAIGLAQNDNDSRLHRVEALTALSPWLKVYSCAGKFNYHE